MSVSQRNAIVSVFVLFDVDKVQELEVYLRRNHNAYAVQHTNVFVFNSNRDTVMRLAEKWGATALPISPDTTTDNCYCTLAERMLARCGSDWELLQSRLSESINASPYRAWICRAMLYGDQGYKLQCNNR